MTFAIKLMETGKNNASINYKKYSNLNLQKLAQDEEKYQQELIALINEERLNYIGAIVLGKGCID